MTVALNKIKNLEGEIEQLKEQIEGLGEGMHLITMSHMYVSQKSEVYERMIKNITKKYCLGDDFEIDIKAKLKDKDLKIFDFIITKYIQSDQDMFKLVIDTSSFIIENMGRRIGEFAAADN